MMQRCPQPGFRDALLRCVCQPPDPASQSRMQRQHHSESPARNGRAASVSVGVGLPRAMTRITRSGRLLPELILQEGYEAIAFGALPLGGGAWGSRPNWARCRMALKRERVSCAPTGPVLTALDPDEPAHCQICACAAQMARYFSRTDGLV
ncbi:hypothetical protein OH77DRAFT_860127 [Trametes cingulata]|nr:hypothetical protein OH77DRAFT_860127 [Trametes cingulata]